jgi:type II secretory pathway pseudopilin PulG
MSSAIRLCRSIKRVRASKESGFALIDLIFVCGIIGLLCSIALPRLAQAKQSAGSASAIGSMRAINSAELTYALTCGGGFYAPHLTTLGIAPPGSTEPFLTTSLTSADTVIKSTYTISLDGAPFAGAPPTCNGLASGASAQGFRAGADPTAPGNVRFFSSNANGIIFENTSSLFSSMPEIGEPPIGHPLR